MLEAIHGQTSEICLQSDGDFILPTDESTGSDVQFRSDGTPVLHQIYTNQGKPKYNRVRSISGQAEVEQRRFKSLNLMFSFGFYFNDPACLFRYYAGLVFKLTVSRPNRAQTSKLKNLLRNRSDDILAIGGRYDNLVSCFEVYGEQDPVSKTPVCYNMRILFDEIVKRLQYHNQNEEIQSHLDLIVNSENTGDESSVCQKLKLVKGLRALNIKADSDLSLGHVDTEYCQANKVRFLVTFKDSEKVWQDDYSYK
jgi:hypothetical protein